MDSVMVDRLGEAAMGAVMDRGLGGTDIVSGWVRHGTWTETDKTQISTEFTIRCVIYRSLCSGHLANRKTNFALNILSSFVVYLRH